MAGNVVTFYSYKGGVGRSFALANVAVILAQWGLRVLAVDWDIEAPGLNHYFEKFSSRPSPGVLDFLVDCKVGAPRPWDHYVQHVEIPRCQGTLSLMPAASAGETDYARTAQELNWDDLYSNHNLGSRLEDLRARWIEQFDVVLIDSRTGVTDFSGITTVQLPDFLVFFFTANRQSLYGCRDIVRRAMEARKRLPIDRPALVPIPIPARFELREEYDRANEWRHEFATALREFFEIWIPQRTDPARMIDNLLIPYVPRWSFGEDLAALLEPTDPTGIRTASFPVSFAIETLAGLLASRLRRVDLFAVSRDEFVLTARALVNETVKNKKMQTKKIFISHTHSDRYLIVDQLVQELEKADFDVWLDLLNIKSGSLWEKQIYEGLDQADALILIVGEKPSSWQEREVAEFVRSGLRTDRERPILPIVLPDGSRQALRAFRFLSNTQFQEINGDAPLQPQLAATVSRLMEILDPNAPLRP